MGNEISEEIPMIISSMNVKMSLILEREIMQGNVKCYVLAPFSEFFSPSYKLYIELFW